MVVDPIAPEVHAHQMRVGALAAERAKAMGLDADTVELVRTAGQLHDCGKLFCLAATRSSGGFNPIIKIHPEKGAAMIRPFFGNDAAELVIGHHPKYLGSTYLESSPAQRAIIEADVWDALREFRPYKASMSVNRASRILSMEGVQGSDLTWWRLTGGNDARIWLHP